MKPGQSSIYRETELLLEFSVRVTERLPKSLPWQVMGKRLVGNLMDCLDFICLAFQAEEGRKRLDEAALYCWHVQSPENAKRLGDAVSTMNSYLGSMKHTLSYGIRRKIFGRASWLWKCCYVSDRFTVVRIRKEFLETHILFIKDRTDYETSK